MESLIRQTGRKFAASGQRTKEEADNIRDRNMPVQRTPSFKPEKRSKTVNWFQGRQFSRQMSQDYDSNNGTEHLAAVAAAAFAIHSLEELSIKDHKQRADKLEDSRIWVPESGKTSKQFSREDTKNGALETKKTSIKSTGEPSTAHLGALGRPVSMTKPTNGKPADRAISPTPSMKKTPTFTDSKKPEYTIPAYPKQPSFPPADIKTLQDSRKPGIIETEADVWEKNELAKISERYEKLKTRIVEWENKKKAKAQRRWERRQSEQERRKSKAMKQYRSEITRVEEISKGALAQAGEHKRNEEFKVKEKANKIRLTGRFPATCFCF